MTSQDEKKVVEKIKNNYVMKSFEQSKLDELKSLDRKVKRPALIFGYTYGIIGSLVLGIGMCLSMKIIGNIVSLGIVLGLIGIAIVSTTYLIYQKILNKRKQKYSEEIISKSDELLNNK